MTWQTTEAEMVVSREPYVAYVVARADGDESWSAHYFGPEGEVEIDTIDDDHNAEWWPSLADARLACEAHRLRMEAGDTAEEAALCVRVSTPRDLEIDLGIAAED